MRWVRWPEWPGAFSSFRRRWRLSLEIPERVRRAGAALVELRLAREGVAVRYDELKFHLLHLRVSIDNVVPARRTRGSPLGTPVRSTSPFHRRRFSPGSRSPGSGSGISAWKRVNGTVRSTTSGWRRGRKGRPLPAGDPPRGRIDPPYPPRSAPPVPDRRREVRIRDELASSDACHRVP